MKMPCGCDQAQGIFCAEADRLHAVSCDTMQSLAVRRDASRRWDRHVGATSEYPRDMTWEQAHGVEKFR